MFQLFFGNLFAALTTFLVLSILVFSFYVHKNSARVTKWGRCIFLFLLAGTAVSAFSAIRDNFMAPGAVFAFTDMQALVCSAAGVLIFLASIASLFFKKQTAKKSVFTFMSILFMMQVLTVEISRIIYL